MKSYTLPYYTAIIFFLIFLFVVVESIIHGFTVGDFIAIGLSGSVALLFYNDYKRYKREYLLRESKYKRLVEKLEKAIQDDSNREIIH